MSSRQQRRAKLDADAAAAAAAANYEAELAEDPYNRPEIASDASRYSLLEQQYLVDTARAEQQQQYAYDSMSTILEVDSEGSELSADRSRGRDSAAVSALLASGGASGKRMSSRTKEASSFDAENRSMSPIAVPEGKNFSGALSALAQQVERLASQEESSRSRLAQLGRDEKSETRVSDSDSRSSTRSPKTTPVDSNDEHEEISLNLSDTTSAAAANSNSRTNPSLVTNPDDDDDESAGEQRPMSAAEALMMIAVSPMVSPRIRLPAQRMRRNQGHYYDDDESADDSDARSDLRRLVEVSNKSTVTSIDFGLMDEMVAKYFVDKLDKGVQSIAFDCDESGDTTATRSRRERTGASPSSSLAGASRGPPVTTKSVAVGTETFSRERFSLLPPTKTRSTQTKSNIDNDIGASETRRFKLSHQDFGSLRRQKQQQRAKTDNEEKSGQLAAAGSGAEKSREQEEARQTVIDDEMGASKRPKSGQSSSSSRASLTRGSPETSGALPAGDGVTPPAANESKLARSKKGSDSKSMMIRSPETRSAVLLAREKSNGAARMQQDSLTDSSSATQVPGESERENSPSPKPKSVGGRASAESNNIRSEEAEPSRTPVGISDVIESLSVAHRGAGEASDATGEAAAEGGKVILSRQSGLIPSLKTELRVIIEFNDSRHKQRDEVTSNSQLVDGKLSKQTQINTSRQVRTTTGAPESPRAQDSSVSAASSPREVYRRLETANREHSLMFNDQRNQPSGIRTGGLTPLRAASSMSSLAKGSSGETATNGWRQVSKSSICNEIETDTHRSRQKQGPQRASGEESSKVATIAEEEVKCGQQLLMSTNARIRHLPDSKSALELSSRAARRFERPERDPITRKPTGSMETVERTLVQSEAGFNENDLEAKKLDSTTKPVQAETRESESSAPSGKDVARDERQTKPMQRVADVRSKPVSLSEGLRHEFSRQPAAAPPLELPQSQIKQPTSRGYAPTDTTRPTKPRSASAQLEIEEESENRRQVTRNGRLVFDDRLSERRYETHRSVAANGGSSLRSPRSSGEQSRQQEQRNVLIPSPAGASSTPGLPSPGGILRNAHVHSPVQRQLLKPISLRASPTKEQHADQTSNLSSDPETMDSGIAPSGAGSSNALNQRPAAQIGNSLLRSPRPAGHGGNSSPAVDPPRRQNEPTSLTFVDDDEEDDDVEMDEFVQQLGTEKVGPKSSRAPSSSGGVERRPNELMRDILPPPKFRSTNRKESAAPVASSAKDPTSSSSSAKPSRSIESKTISKEKELEGVAEDTELITRLTRSRLNQNELKDQRRATQTKFQQNLFSPNTEPNRQSRAPNQPPISAPTRATVGCRLKTQVMFESDTDSSMVLEQQQRSKQAHKELLSETKYSASGQRSHNQMDEPNSDSGFTQRQIEKRNQNPNWMDYSLSVHRLRDSQVDSKVK